MPIFVYHLVGRAHCFEVRSSIGVQLQWQLGFGFRGGCEVVIHGTRKLLAFDPSREVLEADIRDAFFAFFEDRRTTGVDCALALSIVKAFYGRLFSPHYACHRDTEGHFEVLESTMSMREGDLPSGALFAFVHQLALRAASLTFLDHAFPTVLGDIQIFGHPHQGLQNFRAR